MTFAQISGVLEGLLAGLTHAESHGIVHRDLKPENLMVTADGRVKIADFGIAKATTKMQTGAFLTATGTTVGTPTYMAPEQAMAQEIGPWTDLYSVGCMAFELFTGNVPVHDSDAPMAILLRHVNEPIAPVKSIVPDVDQRVSDWIEQLLVKEPSQRTQNAHDAWDEFEEIVLALHGPRWRREARLVERVESANDAKPLTPAPFQGTSAGPVDSEEFKSFAWGEPGADTAAAAAPVTPPPVERVTPPPADAVAETVMPRALRDAPAAPAAPPEAPASPRRWGLIAGIGGAVVVVVVLIAVLAGGGSGGGKPTPTATPAKTPKPVISPSTIDANGLPFQVPGAWKRLDGAPAVPGFTSGA